VEKTADRDATTHLSPPIPFDQVLDDGLQRNPVQWIARMGKIHDRIANGMGLMADFSASCYVLRLRNPARWAKGVKVEGRSCVRPDGGSADGSAT